MDPQINQTENASPQIQQNPQIGTDISNPTSQGFFKRFFQVCCCQTPPTFDEEVQRDQRGQENSTERRESARYIEEIKSEFQSVLNSTNETYGNMNPGQSEEEQDPKRKRTEIQKEKQFEKKDQTEITYSEHFYNQNKEQDLINQNQ